MRYKLIINVVRQGIRRSLRRRRLVQISGSLGVVATDHVTTLNRRFDTYMARVIKLVCL